MLTARSRFPAAVRESIRQHLIEDHRRLDVLFENVMRLLALDDREVTQRAWTLFEQALLAHMNTEETSVLPAFSRENPAAARAIMKDHQKFRATLDTLDIAVDLHFIRARIAGAFIRALRAHARREDALMYRWAEENLLPENRRSILGRTKRVARHASR